MSEKIAVVGLGYVGLPLALALAKVFPGTVGFDTDQKRIDKLKQGIDFTGGDLQEELERSSLSCTSDEENLRGCSIYIVAVPTPIDKHNNPDLGALVAASTIIGQVMQKGAVVVYESTVYPGVTEEICGDVLEKVSGLKRGKEFKLGYSPERINPGDKEHTLEHIIKIVSAEDEVTLGKITSVYSKVVKAGLHIAPTIKVAEAAKVIENVQRDLNIALMNELAIIFDKLNIRTKDVLEAAGTKWNFLRFTPGLVGGHCIGVDPYYLTTKAEQLGYLPQVILAGRRINDGMGKFIAERTVKLMVNQGVQIKGAKVGILGIAFKEDVPDTRNSRVPDIVHELEEYGVSPIVHDPIVDRAEVEEEYSFSLCELDDMNELDALILAVNHTSYLEHPLSELLARVKTSGVFVDVKAVVDPVKVRKDIAYWSL